MSKDKPLISIYGLSFFLVSLSVIVALLGLPFNSGDIIIRFDNYHNEVIWSGSPSIFFGIIGVVFFVIFMNMWLSNYIYDKEKFFSYLLGAGTVIVSLFFLIATFAISLIN